MPPSPVTSKIRKPLYIHRDFTTKITLDDKFILNDLSDSIHILSIQIIAVHCMGKVDLIKDFPRRSETNTMDIGQSTIDMFVFWKVNSCYPSQSLSP